MTHTCQSISDFHPSLHFAEDAVLAGVAGTVAEEGPKVVAAAKVSMGGLR